ncbi:50S ribosomal protein L10 [Candidatus Woesearchaeota archaeon]|nr:50S ribosomal protein L10 [Candidatus Woesearchaeota archaeon]
MPSKPAAHVQPYKKETVQRLAKLLQQYSIIGIVDLQNLPAAQLQKLKAGLRGKIELFMTKKRLMKLAIAAVKDKVKGADELEKNIRGMPALLFTKENPFSLFKTLKKSKSQAPAKAGQASPRDIMVPAGPTPFAPGPVIGELAAVGIKAGVEGGKVAIKQDAVVAKEGQIISAPLAAMLTRLGIEPMEIGLNLVAVWEKGLIYGKDVLDIDENVFLAQLTQAAKEAFNLAIETSYPTALTIELLLQNAHLEAKNLGMEANIMADQLIEDLLAKAERHALAIKGKTGFQTMEGNIAAMVNAPDEKPDAATLVQQAEGLTAEEKKQVTEEKHQKEVEKLTEELKKKGTLR